MRAALLLCVLLASAARAEVWRDPTLDEALKGADLVVRAVALEDGREGVEEVRFQVEEALHGQAPRELAVAGLIDPTRIKGPTFVKRGQRALLLLAKRKRGAGWAIPTPTFGRFRLDGETVKLAPLRDTYLRLDLARDDYERFLRLRLGRRPDPAWLAALRAHLDAAQPEPVPADARARQYLALEALAQVGQAEDAARAAKILTKVQPFQLRISACRALARAAGAKAAGRLLELGREDESKAVRIAAIRALAGLDPPPRGLVEKLAGLLPSATSEPFRLSQGPNDPRTNEWPSPRATLLQAIAKHGVAPVRAQVLAILEEPQVALPVFSVALEALLTLEQDPALPRELAARFRSEREVGAQLYNRELCIALTKLTRQRFGEDVAAWRRWVSR
ncbi:MAG: hypothetical protein AB7N76_19870 [Planctomycetota bacterium]